MPTAATLTSTIHGMLGETHTLVCKITDPGNPDWLHMEWTHESGMDLSGQGSDGNLTITFESLCMAGEFTCIPLSSIGMGTGGVQEVTINGKLFICVRLWFKETHQHIADQGLFTAHNTQLHSTVTSYRLKFTCGPLLESRIPNC